jgi:hypothetical protein
MTAVNTNNLDIEQILPLLQAILHKYADRIIWDRVYDTVTESTPPPRPSSSFQQTPLSMNTGSFANSTEHHKHVDYVPKEELGHLYVAIPGFSKLSSKTCQVRHRWQRPGSISARKEIALFTG